MVPTQPFIYLVPLSGGYGGRSMTLSRVIDGEPSPNGLRRIGVVHGVQLDSVCSTDFLTSQPTRRVKPQGWDCLSRYKIMGFGKDGKGAIVKEQTSIPLGALAAQDLAGVSSAVQLDMDFRILRSDITAVTAGSTSLEGQGLILYMTEGDLDNALSEANIEQNGPLRLGQQVEEEIASRWVRRVGITMGPTVNETERVFKNKYGGGLLNIEPRWTFRRGRTATNGGWNWAVYNSGATLTTGAVVDLIATHYGVWVT